MAKKDAASKRLAEETIARSRRPACVLTSMLSNSLRASLGERTGVLPLLTMCFGPRTETAGFIGITWPMTSQSKRWRIAERRCLTVGAERWRASCST